MPRVEDRLLKAIIYLYESEAAAETGAPGGSGFLVGEPTEIPGAVFLFAVTNAHVIESCPVVRTAGQRDKRLFAREGSEWFRHPEGDDVVVTPIGFAPKDAHDFYLGYVPRRWFVTPENFTEPSKIEGRQPAAWPYGPGEEVVMLGRFLGYDGMEENMPTARFGHLAMAQPVPIPHPHGYSQPSFLVECRSVSGYSGSPVFIYRDLATLGAGPAPIGSLPSGEPHLLGVDWGNLDRIDRNKYSIDWADADAADTYPRRSGMLAAVPAWRLAELLEEKDVQDVKRSEETKVRQTTEGVELDFEPSEFERFESSPGGLWRFPRRS